MASQGIWFMSFLVYGLLLEVSKGQKANYSTSNWNHNQQKYRTTTEPSLEAFDRVNTTDVPEEFEPVTNSRGIVINKPMPGQEMFNDVFNPGYLVTDAGTVSEKHTPVHQPQTRTTTESQLGIFDRINTTDVPEEFEPVINYKGVVINKPVHGQEMYNDTVTQGHTIINSDKVSNNSLPNTPPEHWTTTETRLGAFDIINTIDLPEQFEPVTNSRVEVIKQPVPGQEMHKGNRNMSRLIKQEVVKVQAAESRIKQGNMIVRIVNTLAMKGKDSKGQVQLYSVIRKKQGNKLTKARSSRKQGTDKERSKTLNKSI